MTAVGRLLRRGIGGETGDEEAFRPGETRLTDPRAAGLMLDAEDEVGLRDRARAALEEAHYDLDDDRLDAVVSSLRGIKKAARDLKSWMIETGRLLSRLQEAAGEGGYRSLFRAGLVDIPESTASNLRLIARAVDEKKVEPRHLPSAIKPAYALARLSADKIALVVEKVTLGSETTVREIREAAGVTTRNPKPKPQSRLKKRQLRDAERGLLALQRDTLESRVRKLEKDRDEEVKRVRNRFAQKIEKAKAELAAIVRQLDYDAKL